MAIKALFFDLDDTLCNTSGSREERALLAASAIHDYHGALSKEQIVDLILQPHPETDWPMGPRHVLEQLGLAEHEVAAKAIGYWFFEGCDDLIVSYPACVDTLAMLQSRYTLGVITNGPVHIQRRKFDALAIETHFHPGLFLASEAVGYAKPDRRIFDHALRLAGVDAHEAAFMGDWAAVDVAGAQNAGLKGIWFNPEDRPTTDGIVPDAVIRSHQELPALLQSWG